MKTEKGQSQQISTEQRRIRKEEQNGTTTEAGERRRRRRSVREMREDAFEQGNHVAKQQETQRQRICPSEKLQVDGFEEGERRRGKGGSKGTCGNLLTLNRLAGSTRGASLSNKSKERLFEDFQPKTNVDGPCRFCSS
jgi:hypothetical protein